MQVGPLCPMVVMSLLGIGVPFSDVRAQTQHSEQDRACAALGAAHVEKAKTERGRDYANRKTTTFYSAALEACVHVEIAIVGVDIEIRDLSHSVMRDGGNFNVLLDCTADGANSVILPAVRARFGRVFEVPYREWLDDGFGGPPATLKTPDRPYSQADCRRLLDQWLAILNG